MITLFSIIVSFPSIQDANKLKNLLVHNGIEVNAVCTTGAQVIGLANELESGIVICGYRMSDMLYREINGYLPRGFELLLIASASRLNEVIQSSIVCLCMPIKTLDLINTVNMMTHRVIQEKKREKAKQRLNEHNRVKAKTRSTSEQVVIDEAKRLLMERNHLTEGEAHHYIQKCSMDRGIQMAEMASIIMTIM